MAQKTFYTAAKYALVSVYAIFIAGAVVRMTGSGMGCPDWPKCFGYYIPPTNETQIKWHPQKNYKKGTMIVFENALFVARKNLKTGTQINPENWQKYTKHSYAKFNVFHTWTEYINRLVSVVSGFVFLWLLYVAFRFRKQKSALFWWCVVAFLLMLFEAWMGKKVVDTVLKPKIITLHMVFGLFIIQILIGVLHNLAPSKKHNKTTYTAIFFRLLLGACFCSLLQIAMGTQVRQFVDEQIQIFGFTNKQMRLYQPNLNFYVHRSFTIFIVLLNFFVFFKALKIGFHSRLPLYILLIIGVEAFTGILMYYVNFPMGTQSIHFVAGIVMFGLQSYLIWDYRCLKIIR